MVTQVSSFSRNGVSDWIIQRVSALVLAAYFLCVFGFVVLHPGLDYATWSGYFNHPAMQVFTLLETLVRPIARRLKFKALPAANKRLLYNIHSVSFL